MHENFDRWISEKKKILRLTFKILENFLNNNIVIKLHKRQIITELSTAQITRVISFCDKNEQVNSQGY